MVLLHQLSSKKKRTASSPFVSPFPAAKIPKPDQQQTSAPSSTRAAGRNGDALASIDKMASTLADAGCTLINPLGPPCLPSDHHKLRAHLNRRFSSSDGGGGSDSSSLRSDFMAGFSSYIDSRQNLQRVLAPSGVRGESLVRNLLLVPAIQQELQSVLLEKLPAYFDENSEQCGTSLSLEDDVARLIINQFRWLDFLVDPKGFTEKLMEVLSISPLRLKKEIIGSLPEIIGDQNNELMVDSLEQLLREDSGITVPVLDAYSNLTLDDMLQDQVITTALSCIRTIEGEQMPYLLRFLLLSATPVNVRRIIQQIREQLKFVGLSSSLASQQSKLKGKFVVDNTEGSILEALGSSLLFKNMLCQEILKELYSLRTPEDFKVIDIWLLVLIYKSGESMQKSVEKILKKKIVDNCMSEVPIDQCICQNKGLVKDYFSSFISLAEYLLASKETKARDFGKHIYTRLFEELDDNYCRQEVLGVLVTHVGSGVSFEVTSALEVLSVLAFKYTRDFIPHSSFLNGILDYLEGFGTENLHKVYEVFGQLALSTQSDGSCHGSSIAHELFMIVRKQISHPNMKYKKMGLIGVLKMISCLGEENAFSLTASAGKSDSTEILELLRASLDSCKSVPLLLVLFYDELTAMLESKKLHPGIMDWIGKQLVEFESTFLADLDGGQLPAVETYCGLEGELWMNLDGDASPVCLSILPLVSSSADSTSSLQILPANFLLLSAFERLTSQGSLSGIDALLGCPLHLPCFSYFTAASWQSLSVKQKQTLCLSLYYAANWIRELLNAFCTQVAGQDECTSQAVKEEIVVKLSKRLRNLICLESLLNRSMKQHNLSLPEIHCHAEEPGVLNQSKNTVQKRNKQNEVHCSVSPKNKKHKRMSKDSTSSDINGKLRQQTLFDVLKKAGSTATQEATDADASTPCSKSPTVNSAGEESRTSKEPVIAEFSAAAKGLVLHRYKFRPLLVQCLSLLTFSKNQESCCSDPSAELPLYLYLLQDLHSKLDYFIPPKQSFPPRCSRSSASFSRMTLREFLNSIRPLFPFVKSHFDTAVSVLKEGDETCKEHWDVHSASAGNPEAASVIPSKYSVSTSVSKEVLKCFSKMINLPDIQMDKSILSDLLQAFQPDNIPSSVSSGIQPIPSPGTTEYLYLGAFSFVENVMDIACSCSFTLASESLFTLESITASIKALLERWEKNGEKSQLTSMTRLLNVLHQRASTLACKLLRQEWDNGSLENGWKDKGEIVQRMLQIYLDNSDSKANLLDELACSVLPQFSSPSEDDEDHGFPSLCNATFLVWYRVLHEANITILNQKVPKVSKAGGAAAAAQSEIVEKRLIDLRKSVNVLVSLVNLCRLHDKVNMHSMAVKYGGKFVDSFLKAFDYLEAHFQTHNDLIIKLMGAEIYDPRLYIDPGPRDRRYLTGQDQHRSRSIWNNNPESLIPISHRGTCRLPRWHPRLHPYLERAGLHNLRHFMRLDIDNDLLTAMTERWRPELHTFHFPEGEMTITLKDVAILTGLPITGDAIIDSSRKPEDGWGPLIQERLGFNMPTTTPVEGVGHPPLNAGQVSIPWLVDHIQLEVNIGLDTPEDQVERYARVYLIALVGGFLFPDKSNKWIQGMWFPMLLGDWDEIGRKSWGSAVLAGIYRELCTCSRLGAKQAGGAMFILQLWAWEHLPFLAPQDPREFWLPDDELRFVANPPYGFKWIGANTNDHQAEHSLLFYRAEFDKPWWNQAVWDPYPNEVVELHRLRHPEDQETWLCKVPLICWHMVEWHLPDRSLRQYRLEQPIPASPPQGFRELHAIDLRYNKKDWTRKHEFYINIWENRNQWVVQGAPETRPMGYHDGYMRWYRHFTLRWVSKQGAVWGAVVDGLEHAKHTVESAPTMDERKTSFLRRLFNNLLCCTREQRRDVILYPPVPAPARPSFRADERIVPPEEPPRRSRRRVREHIDELRPSQQTQLPQPWPHCEWATSTEGTGGSSSYAPTMEHDMFTQATPQFHHQQQTTQYQTPQQQHTSSTFYHTSGPTQQPPPPPPVYTPVGGRVKRNPRAVVQRAREEGGGGREGGRRGRGGRGGRGRGREGEVEGNEDNQ